MRLALEILGYPNPYHFSSFYDNVSECDLWLEAINAKYNGIGELKGKEFFDSLLGHVGATTDAPCNSFAEELLRFYPEAKVVLVERGVESWFGSWMGFCESAYNPVLFWLSRLDPFWLGRIPSLGSAIVQIHAGHSLTLSQARARSKTAYKHYYRDIRDQLSSEPSRILEFKLEQGWKPLCEFLGKEIPDVPFPHENESERNKLGFKEVGFRGLGNIGWNLGWLGVGVGVLVWGFGRVGFGGLEGLVRRFVKL